MNGFTAPGEAWSKRGEGIQFSPYILLIFFFNIPQN